MPYNIKTEDDGILRVTHIGDFGKDQVAAYIDEITPYLEAPQAGPLHVLVDHRQAGKVDAAARRVLREVARKNQKGKVAIVGVSAYVRVLISFMQRASNNETVRLFESEEEGLAWLRNGT